jgi:hypothetical protein
MKKKEKIEIKDIHSTYWRSRDFELSSLWQRSVFLTAFLVLLFTAYGAVFIKLLEIENHIYKNLIAINLTCFVLSILGIILSILWIKMAKGSKAWYEVYERAIRAIERDEKYIRKELKDIGGFESHKLDKYVKLEVNNNLFSGKSGQYSVSKINIGIGQVFLIFWLMAGITHVIYSSMILHDLQNTGYYDVILCAMGIGIISFVLISFGGASSFRSSSLSDY